MLTPDLPTRELALRLGDRALSFGEAIRRVKAYEAAAVDVAALVERLDEAARRSAR